MCLQYSQEALGGGVGGKRQKAKIKDIFFELAVLFHLNELRIQTNVPLFGLLAGASLFIYLISSPLTFASSFVLLSNSP